MFFRATDQNNLLNSYWEKVTSMQCNVTNMLELFLSRYAAFIHLNSSNEHSFSAAKSFLLSTMKQSEQEYDFKSKENFVKSVGKWELPQILAQRCDDQLMAIVYKIKHRINGVHKELYEISFFEKNKESGALIYSHKFDLANLHQRYCQSEEFDVTIRQLGDSVLHKPAKNIFDFSDSRLLEQVNILKHALTKTGGAGIAANQCAAIHSPLKIILVGVDYQNPEHVVKALTRYPTTLFPPLKICFQPKIMRLDHELEVFPEGCLSTQGKFRAKVRRPKKLTVGYQNIDGKYLEETFTGSDARAMLHELDHILNGKVYIQRIIEELTHEQCKTLKHVLDEVIADRIHSQPSQPFLDPVVIFDRDDGGSVIFNKDQIYSVFSQIRMDVVQSINQLVGEKLNAFVSLSGIQMYKNVYDETNDSKHPLAKSKL